VKNSAIFAYNPKWKRKKFKLKKYKIVGRKTSIDSYRRLSILDEEFKHFCNEYKLNYNILLKTLKNRLDDNIFFYYYDKVNKDFIINLRKDDTDSYLSMRRLVSHNNKNYKNLIFNKKLNFIIPIKNNNFHAKLYSAKTIKTAYKKKILNLWITKSKNYNFFISKWGLIHKEKLFVKKEKFPKKRKKKKKKLKNRGSTSYLSELINFNFSSKYYSLIYDYIKKPTCLVNTSENKYITNLNKMGSFSNWFYLKSSLPFIRKKGLSVILFKKYSSRLLWADCKKSARKKLLRTYFSLLERKIKSSLRFLPLSVYNLTNNMNFWKKYSLDILKKNKSLSYIYYKKRKIKHYYIKHLFSIIFFLRGNKKILFPLVEREKRKYFYKLAINKSIKHKHINKYETFKPICQTL
jgi:hypothetical protein